MATILVVDDESSIRQLVEMILKMSGHAVLAASNGLEALMVFSSYHARLDLVLTGAKPRKRQNPSLRK